MINLSNTLIETKPRRSGRSFKRPLILIVAIAALGSFCLHFAYGADDFGPYRADVIRVIDGDSFKALINVFPNDFKKLPVRVNRVDTPELRGKCDAEKKAAIVAREFTRAFIGDRIVVDAVFFGKFGRIVADVRNMNGDDLAAALIKNGHGRPYDGGKRRGWCSK